MHLNEGRSEEAIAYIGLVKRFGIIGRLGLCFMAACAVGSSVDLAGEELPQRASTDRVLGPTGSTRGDDASADPSSVAPGPNGSSTDAAASGSLDASGGAFYDASLPPPDASPSLPDPGTGGGACGVCDRDWFCNNVLDLWLTEGSLCVNQRTKTALRCDGKFEQGGTLAGTWTGTDSKLTLYYPMLGGGTRVIVCVP